ncbi:MAG TPA: RIP metalloprotease RseP [Magnetospirillaceae bacterium]|jgi:regulator of sigma E protease
MVQLLIDFWDYVVVFLVVITVIVFVHELGHYLIARANGVRVETFSIGFGPELFGFTAKSGTRWKFSLLPLGGYVRMFGDMDGPGDGEDKVAAMTPEERAVAFRTKKVYQRASIVVAGPLINFVFGIFLLALLFMIYGEQRIPPVVGAVITGSAAEQAGLKPGDKVLIANGDTVSTFGDLQVIVQTTVGEPVQLLIERDGKDQTITVQPRLTDMADSSGHTQKVPILGVTPPKDAAVIIHHNPLSALVAGVNKTRQIVGINLKAIGQIVTGRRDTDQLSGPVGIAKQVGQAARLGLQGILFFAAYISINLGLFNLFPIPLLDGGHLLFYCVEAVLGRPLGPRAQEYGFRLGLFLVLALMILATGNDLGVWKFIRGIVS